MNTIDLFYSVRSCRESLELSKTNPIWNRHERMNAFIDWLHSHQVDTSNFDICSFDDYGFGLKANKDLQVTVVCAV
jgi:hypothetical protein